MIDIVKNKYDNEVSVIKFLNSRSRIKAYDATMEVCNNSLIPALILSMILERAAMSHNRDTVSISIRDIHEHFYGSISIPTIFKYIKQFTKDNWITRRTKQCQTGLYRVNYENIKTPAQ